MKTKFVKRDSYAEGVTSRGIVFKFSLEDWELVTRHSWCVDPRGYLAATYNKKHTVLHRLIMNAPILTLEQLPDEKLLKEMVELCNRKSLLFTKETSYSQWVRNVR